MDSKLSNIIKEKSKEYDFPLPSAKLYLQLTELEKRKVDSKTDSVGVERAELIYNLENKTQIIITQNHLITAENNICLSEISSFNIDKSEQKAVRENFDRMIAKFELTKWIIELRDEPNIEIKLEKGKAYFSFYHILQKLLKAKGHWG